MSDQGVTVTHYLALSCRNYWRCQKRGRALYHTRLGPRTRARVILFEGQHKSASDGNIHLKLHEYRPVPKPEFHTEARKHPRVHLFPRLVWFFLVPVLLKMEVFGDNSCNTLGFLQKNNSLDEKGRLAGQKNMLACNNSERDARFRRTETDFSNLFARGEDSFFIK